MEINTIDQIVFFMAISWKEVSAGVLAHARTGQKEQSDFAVSNPR
jgi:hypothetical protein